MEDDKIRFASHAGTWYSDNKSELKQQLEAFLEEAKLNENAARLKGIIVPHAGYRFSAPTAAWAYKNIDRDNFDRIIILGPSHHMYIPGCGLTQLKIYETPFGKFKIDTQSIQKLSQIKGYYPIDKETDEKEHSLEMQLPILKYVFGDKDVKLLPIMVGQTNLEQDQLFAESLSEFYKDNRTLFIISSDFCHWGKRFNFTYTNSKYKNIYEGIEYLDKLAIGSIESLDPENFDSYLKDHRNTICGRRAISILLCLAQMKLVKNKITFINYSQSSQVTSMNDSSVSYAAGLNILL
jgi:AmmeMemoRadiSam system protein B